MRGTAGRWSSGAVALGLASLALAAAVSVHAQPLPYAQAFGPAAPAPAAAIPVLSSADLQRYAAAFDAVRRGQFEAADMALDALSDDSLVGRVQYAKLMQPGYAASWAELKVWLAKFRDLPGADKIYQLAKKRQPKGERGPELWTDTNADTRAWSETEQLARQVDLLKPQVSADPDGDRARQAYFSGDPAAALPLALKAGERWIAGLAAYRLKSFAQAERSFAALAADEFVNDWTRAGAAFWAARAAVAAGRASAEAAYLQVAAAAPYTFYGQIAARRLQLLGVPLQPAAQAPGLAQKVGLVTGVKPSMDTLLLIQADPRAHRIAALAQLGLRAEAAEEVKAAIQGAGSQGAREDFASLALVLGLPLPQPRPGKDVYEIDPARFPTPALAPRGGFTLDRALVYAVIRQETRFEADAVSYAGAVGLMQMTPGTAAMLGYRQYASVAALKNPAVNLRLGQDYIAWLLDQTGGDLIQALAGYNCGPAPVQRTRAQLGADGDSLLFLESVPAGQTREYVQKVMANYWIYRQLMGRPLATLDALAQGARSVQIALDQAAPAQAAPAQAAPEFALATASVGQP